MGVYIIHCPLHDTSLLGQDLENVAQLSLHDMSLLGQDLENVAQLCFNACVLGEAHPTKLLTLLLSTILRYCACAKCT